jgi:hypothetical protein
MHRQVITTLLAILLLFASVPLGFGCEYCQLDPQLEKLFHEQATLLKQNIKIGWTQEDVLRIMGEPDRQKTVQEGTDIVDIWGYHGYEVRIEFRNGFVSKWFFRHMR